MSLSAPHRHKAFSFSVLSCCLATLVSGTSYDYGFDAAKSHQSKRASDDIVVNAGMPLNDDGSAPVRLEIRDLEKDEDRWSLYILALDMLQYTDQTEPTSWYGITGMINHTRRSIFTDTIMISFPRLTFDLAFVIHRHTRRAFRTIQRRNAYAWQ